MLRRLVATLPDDVDRFCSLVEEGRQTASDFLPRLIAESAAQGVLGTIAPHVSAMGLPPDLAEHVERRTTVQQLWDSHVCESLQDVVSALDRAGIRPCVLKGPVLAARLYQLPEARSSIDIDLLVLPSEVEHAARALADAGYQGDTDAQVSYLRRHSHHLHFQKPGAPMLELHFHAYAGFGVVLPASALIDRAAEYELADHVRVRVPAPEDEFIYLAAHVAGHSFIRLVWLYDLKLLLRRHPSLDWDGIASRARTLGVLTALTCTLQLLERWLEVDLSGLPAPLRRRRMRMRLADRLLTE